MTSHWEKWDMVYVSRYPESVDCESCKQPFLIHTTPCEHCKKDNVVSNIVNKVRPVLLWIGQDRWFQSMSFGIPLSTTNIHEGKYEHPIYLNHYQFLHRKKERNKPMRVMITQATRIDGMALKKSELIGKLNDIITQRQIENKLMDWIFEIKL